MKIFMKFKIWMLALIVVATACYPEQDLAPVKASSSYPTASITAMADYSTISEGDTLKYTITTSGVLKYDVQFGATVGESSEAMEGYDFEIVGGSLTKYTSSTELWVVILADDFPELSESIVIEISAAPDKAYSWQLSSESDVISINSSITNVNYPDGVTVAMSWEDPDHEIDFDVFVESIVEGTWSTAGATGANPEVDHSVWTADPDGSYAYAVDPYSVPDGDITYTIHIGYPDGTVESKSGIWNNSSSDTYPTTTISAYGFDAYTVLTIAKAGSTFTPTYAF
ncbi:MAG: hypothetical protein ACI83W_000276 [Marinoscillum sp.]|jgi:hypothetical protein